MSLGNNIQILRKQKKITQEELAEEMNVSRQAVSKWENDEIVPELEKLVSMSEFFSCNLDRLVKENIAESAERYSAVTVKEMPEFMMARYVMITPNPEDDVNNYMRTWAEKAGLLKVAPDAMLIGWDFPFVTQEQQNRFGLRGYGAAYILPKDFKTEVPGVEFAKNRKSAYAKITVYNPFERAFEYIPNGYKKILEYLSANNFKETPSEDLLSCFEHVYEKDGILCMDIYMQTESVIKADSFGTFSR